MLHLSQMNPVYCSSLTHLHILHAPFTCQSKMKLEQFHEEIEYMFKVFHAVFKKFLTAIDHIDYHPSQKQNTTRVKRSEMYSLYGLYYAQTRTLTPSEEIFLDQFLKGLIKINPSLHNSLAHMKRSKYLYLDLRMGSIL